MTGLLRFRKPNGPSDIVDSLAQKHRIWRKCEYSQGGCQSKCDPPRCFLFTYAVFDSMRTVLA
jgi:hypothetical protein